MTKKIHICNAVHFRQLQQHDSVHLSLVFFTDYSFSSSYCVTFCIFRPHHSTMYVDAAYCYRWSSIVCLSQSSALQKWIDMPSGLWTRVSPKNNYEMGVQISHGKGQFSGRKGRPIVKYREYCPCAMAMRPFVKLL